MTHWIHTRFPRSGYKIFAINKRTLPVHTKNPGARPGFCVSNCGLGLCRRRHLRAVDRAAPFDLLAAHDKLALRVEFFRLDLHGRAHPTFLGRPIKKFLCQGVAAGQ